MGITMIFNYALLGLALLFILLTKSDEKTTDDCHVPTHHHEHVEQEMDDLQKGKEIDKVE